MARCTTTQDHCESCGSTSVDAFSNDGYSPCCNELIVRAAGCRDHHGREARYQAALDAGVEAAGYSSRRAMIDADPAAWEALADSLASTR